MKLSKYIDHTLLKATATPADIQKLCQEAVKYDFKSVCVNPGYVALAKECLAGSNVLVCTVIGFPLGANTQAIKCAETKDAVANGADEIDMVINIGLAKAHKFALIEEEIAAVVLSASGRLVKVIIETCYLTDAEKVAVCEAAVRAGANFVKTSTGFGTGGATVADVKLMKQTVGDQAEVKASGGVRSPEDFAEMRQAGATRIGTSGGIKLLGGTSSDSDSAY